MRRVMLDTGVAADYIFRRGNVLERAKSMVDQGIKVGIAMPAIGELFAGAENSRSRERNLVKLKQTLHALRIWPFDRRAAEEFGRLYAHLRAVGRPMPQIDIQIAAIALSLGGCMLATRDSDFKAIPGLTVESW